MYKEASYFDGKRAWVTCQKNPVGAAIVRRLWRERCEIVLADRSQLDLVRQSEVESWFRQQKPDVVFMTSEAPNRLADGAAGPASILHGRLAATVNILAAARAARVDALVNVTAWGGASPRGTAPSDKALAGLAASRLMQGYARDEGCRFAVLLANPDGASPDLSDAFRRLREAEYRAEPEVEIPIEGGAVPPALLHADDLADAAVFLARSYAGAHPVHCDSDDATLDEVFRILALRAGYAGRVVLRRVVRAPSERLVEFDRHQLARVAAGRADPPAGARPRRGLAARKRLGDLTRWRAQGPAARASREGSSDAQAAGS